MSVCLFTGVLVLRQHSSEFSSMWGWDPLTRDNQSHETQTGQQLPAAAHSVNLQPAACVFALLIQPQMPFNNVPWPRKMRQCNGKGIQLCHRITLSWKRPFTKAISLGGSQRLVRAMAMLESSGEPFQENTDL